jgi:hypothetical protein
MGLLLAPQLLLLLLLLDLRSCRGEQVVVGKGPAITVAPLLPSRNVRIIESEMANKVPYNLSSQSITQQQQKNHSKEIEKKEEIE